MGAMPWSCSARRHLGVGFLLALLLASIGLGAAAQSQATVRLSPPIIDEFPIVTLHAAVLGRNGQRIPGLPASSFLVLEGDAQLQPFRAEEVSMGTRQVFVLNTNQGMGIRDSHGRPRFHFARAALLEWWRLPEASQLGLDELSLITASGPLVEHTESAARLAAALSAFQPEYVETEADYGPLLAGLDSLSTASEPGLPSFLIFLTAMPRHSDEAALSDALARARDTGTVIYPVLVDAPEALELPEAQPLRRLADRSGGQLVLLNPAAPGLTELADRVLDQRTQYRLQYRSRLRQSGSHQIQVLYQGNEISASSDQRRFSLEVLPPELLFVQPPSHIIRQTDDAAVPVQAIPPTSASLELLVTFPDDHPRELASLELLANDVVVERRSQPPFDRLVWDLSGYRRSQEVSLRAVLTDSLGLQSETYAQRVFIEVIHPPGGLLALGPALGPLLAVVAALVSGVLLSVWLVGRIQTEGPSEASARASTEPGLRKLSRVRMQPISEEVAPEAYLIPVQGGVQVDEAIPLTGADIALGSDASLSAHPLAEASVSGLHARIIRQAGGAYLIRDQGSVAGTWVNYGPVPEAGTRLRHGDLIHLGRAALQFQLASPPPPAEIRIQAIDPAFRASPEEQHDRS